MAIDQSKIRNFCIIAHIDHGKSTLADRIIERTGLLTSREMQSQVLDSIPVLPSIIAGPDCLSMARSSVDLPTPLRPCSSNLSPLRT